MSQIKQNFFATILLINSIDWLLKIPCIGRVSAPIKKTLKMLKSCLKIFIQITLTFTFEVANRVIKYGESNGTHIGSISAHFDPYRPLLLIFCIFSQKLMLIWCRYASDTADTGAIGFAMIVYPYGNHKIYKNTKI